MAEKPRIKRHNDEDSVREHLQCIADFFNPPLLDQRSPVSADGPGGPSCDLGKFFFGFPAGLLPTSGRVGDDGKE